MALTDVHDSISVFVQSQFPQIYESEDGQLFIAFLRAYYEYLEQNDKELGISRDLLEQADIDQTTSTFLKHFKKTYLFSIPEETTVDFPFLIKHIFDLYRSKGSQRALELFFRLVYGVNSDLYLPSEHIFKASDAKFIEPRYIECHEGDTSTLQGLLGSQVEGSKSGATAFVSAIVETRGRNHRKQEFVVEDGTAREYIGSGIIHVLFLSQMVGEFVDNEIVTNGTQSIRTNGSLSGLSIVYSGPDYELGQELIVEQQNGTAIPGRARVTSLREASGVPRYTLHTKGSGYSTNSFFSNVAISDHIVTVENVRNSERNPVNYIEGEATNEKIVLEDIFDRGKIILEEDFVLEQSSPANSFHTFETVVYPRVDIGFTADNENMLSSANTQSVLRLFDGDLEVANGRVSGITNAAGESTNGTITVFEVTGSFAIEDYVLLEDGDTLLQEDGSSKLTYETSGTANSSFVLKLNGNDAINAAISNTTNNFVSATFLADKINTSNTSETIIGMTANTGLMLQVAQSMIRGVTSNTIADITGNRSPAIQANISITDVRSPVALDVNTDYITDAFANTRLSASHFGFDKANTANVGNVLSEALTTHNENFGQIERISIIETGDGFTADPPILVQNRYLDGFLSNDVKIKYSDLAIDFEEIQIGEVLKQVTSRETQTLTFSNFSSTNTQHFAVGQGVKQVVNSTVNIFAVVNAVVNTTALTLSEIRSINSSSIVTGTGHGVTFTANNITQLGVAAANSVNTVATQTNATADFLAFGEVLTSNTVTQELTMRMISNKDFRPTDSTWGRLQSNNNSKSLNIDEISSVDDSNGYITFDTTKRLGLNANVNAVVETGNNLINTTSIIESGYNFHNGKDFVLRSTSNNEIMKANGTVVVQGTGVGKGFHQTDTGFASDPENFIHDNDFYQAYSYQVLSEFSIDKYEKLLKEVIHTAGFKLFGKVVLTPYVTGDPEISESSITQSG